MIVSDAEINKINEPRETRRESLTEMCVRIKK